MRLWFRKPPGPPIRVDVYSRAECHLCDVAWDLLERYRERHRLEMQKIDVDADPALRAAYGERVPVIVIDGKERFFGRIDEVLLRRILVQRD